MVPIGSSARVDYVPDGGAARCSCISAGPSETSQGVRTIERLRDQPHERLVQRVTAGTYGTVLILAALPLIKVTEVGSGVGWELVTGVGVATYIAARVRGGDG